MGGFSDDRSVWLARHVLPHEPALRAWLRQKRNLPIDVDDLVQESYAILAGLPTVDHVLNPRAYIFQVAHSLILRELRRARVVSIRAVDDLDAFGATLDEPSPERQVADREELQHLADAMARLPRQCGEAFRLRKVEGYSQREIALHMGVSESTVEKHVAKAVKILMETFGRGGKAVVRASTKSTGRILADNGKARDQ